ncbi:MAG: hypothetical protein ACOVNU_08040 [Candidatus Kapaibacteriota bacterium]
MKAKYYKIVSSIIGVVFEHSLTLDEAKSIVEKWEESDKFEGIYTPNFYIIKEDIEEGNE